jgi:UDP-3-O-acyl-N-acetylglucosamine deacetylase
MSTKIIEIDRRQATLAKPAKLTGVSVRDFEPCYGEVLPAPDGHGIVFEIEGVRVPVSIRSFIKGGPNTTTLSAGGATVVTVEHLLAALHGLDIDNVLVRLGPGGIPFKDFSAESFTEALLAAGRRELDAPRSVIAVTAPFRVTVPGDDRYAEFLPAEDGGFEVDSVTEFPGLVGRQTARFASGESDFARDLAWARSFCPRPIDQGGDRWARVRARYPILPEDPRESPMVAFSSDGYLTPLRQPNELACHKLLDFLGDILLCGHFMSARVKLYKSGHTFNAVSARELVNRLA